MGKHLVLVGGGHAHLTTLLTLNTFVKAGHRVTVVSPSSYHYYSGMGPGMLSGMYRPQDVRFNIKAMSEGRGATFVEDVVLGIAPVSRILTCQSGKEITYDVVSFNTGSSVSPLLASRESPDTVPVKPIQNLLGARRRILSLMSSGHLRLLVVGGGAAGVEIAGNLWRLVRDGGGSASIRVVTRGTLLGEFPRRVREVALRSLLSRGIAVHEGTRVERSENGSLHSEGGEPLDCDMAFLATGVRPSSIFERSGLPTGKDAGLLVNRYLQSTARPEIFGGGDCISLEGHPLKKVGVYAVRQNPVLCANLMAALEGSRMRAFDPGGKYLLILNMGNGKGILWKGDYLWHGRLAFVLKDYIDRRFMRKFQVSGEQAETREPPGEDAGLLPSP